MTTPTPNSFADRARAMFDQEDEARAKQTAAQQVADQRQARIAAEGPAVAQAFLAELVQQVRDQVVAVGRVFALPAVSQKGAAIEVVVRDKWLLTGQASGGTTVAINVYDLVAQNNPRMRERSDSLDHVRYRIDLNHQDQWVWRHDGGSAPVGVKIFSPELRTPAELTNEALVAHFLDKALALAQDQDKKPRSGSAFHAF